MIVIDPPAPSPVSIAPPLPLLLSPSKKSPVRSTAPASLLRIAPPPWPAVLGPVGLDASSPLTNSRSEIVTVSAAFGSASSISRNVSVALTRSIIALLPSIVIAAVIGGSASRPLVPVVKSPALML